MDLTVLI